MAGEIFISYRRADELRARLLHSLLKERGVEAWYDAHVGAGQDWRAATAKALDAAPIFVLLFSQNASASDDIAKELAAATLNRKLVVPVRLESIKLEGAFLYELASRNWFDAYDDTETKLALLADRLAALVKAGPNADPATLGLASNQPPRPRFSRRLLVPAIVLAALAVAVLAWTTIAAGPPAAPTNQRVAFFGFTSEDDLVSKRVASIATDETFQGMTSLRIETAARADSLDTPPDKRLARAKELGAQYALSGEVRIEGDAITVAVRLEDVPSRSTLSDLPLRGDTSQPRALSVQAAAKATDLLSCLARFRESTRGGDAGLMQLIADYCGHLRESSQDRVPAARELAGRAPDSVAIQAAFATTLGLTLSDTPIASWPDRIAEAEAAIERAVRLDPSYLGTWYARWLIGQRKGAPLAELEKIAKAGLETTPSGDIQARAYSNLSSALSDLIAATGQRKKALSYSKDAVTFDRYGPAKHFAYARRLAEDGQLPEADRVFRDASERLPVFYGWGWWVASAIFLDAGDAEALLASPSQLAPPDQVDCWRKFDAAYRTGAKNQAAAAQARACLKRIPVDAPQIMPAMAALGDFDEVFARAHQIDRRLLMSGIESLFWPTDGMRRLRSDDRFQPLTVELGLWDYWIATGTHPDVCDSEDIPLCTALKTAGAGK